MLLGNKEDDYRMRAAKELIASRFTGPVVV
jgi:hypothetical protein